jgi:hypothetical protein
MRLLLALSITLLVTFGAYAQVEPAIGLVSFEDTSCGAGIAPVAVE